MTSNDFRATADVSCPCCGAGWWVTNPDSFAWDGCPDCRGKCDCQPGEQETGWHEIRCSSCREADLDEWGRVMDAARTWMPPGERGTAVVVGLGLFFCLLGLSTSVVFYIGKSRGLW